jgi:hypothetical protein
MANGPVTLTLLTDVPTEPVLMTAMRCAALVVPTDTEPKAREVGETETAVAVETPVPARVAEARLPALTLNVSLTVLATVGAKTTYTSQWLPGARTPFQVAVARQEFWEMTNGPVTLTLLTDVATEPVLMTAMRCAALVVPTDAEPNARLVGETETAVALEPPVPARVTGATLPAALTLNVSLTVLATVGAKTTYTSQWVPGARTPFQVAVARQEFWEMTNGPVTLTLLTDAPTEPVFVTAMPSAALVVPTGTEPKARLVGETEKEVMLDTVTVTAVEVVTMPLVSRATAVKA